MFAVQRLVTLSLLTLMLPTTQKSKTGEGGKGS